MSRVLVVDDAADIRLLLRITLERAGLEVREASSGTEALRLVEGSQEPEVVVLDVQMPDMSGWDTLSAIRYRLGEAGPAVIMCTVKAHDDDARRAWRLGCDGYVVKPLVVGAFVDEVMTVAARSHFQRLTVRAAKLAALQPLVG
jgi:CheY-like chemotaxis protein